jgi:hypothetical protein
MMSPEEELNNDGMVKSPQKVNQTANTQTGLPKATATNHANAIVGVIRGKYKDNNKTTLPPDLMALALRAGIDPAEIIPIIPNRLTTPRRGKRKKAATSSAWNGAVQGSLLVKHFVISGM